MQHWGETFIKFIELGIMLIGLFGLIVPVFPGITVIWGIAIIHGVIFGFTSLGWWILAIMTVLAIVGWISDNLLMGVKARERGAHWLSITLSLSVGFVASFILTPIGGIGASILALFLAEYGYTKDQQEAWEITKQMIFGWGWAFVVRFGIGALMIGLWAIWAW
ncbi:MAG: DUF456 domain-containing protein [Anaerolineae bacterium]|nr:DUF456 domain-containing protein [Anaerolineae bacterium]